MKRCRNRGCNYLDRSVDRLKQHEKLDCAVRRHVMPAVRRCRNEGCNHLERSADVMKLHEQVDCAFLNRRCPISGDCCSPAMGVTPFDHLIVQHMNDVEVTGIMPHELHLSIDRTQMQGRPWRGFLWRRAEILVSAICIADASLFCFFACDLSDKKRRLKVGVEDEGSDHRMQSAVKCYSIADHADIFAGDRDSFEWRMLNGGHSGNVMVCCLPTTGRMAIKCEIV